MLHAHLQCEGDRGGGKGAGGEDTHERLVQQVVWLRGGAKQEVCCLQAAHDVPPVLFAFVDQHGKARHLSASVSGPRHKQDALVLACASSDHLPSGPTYRVWEQECWEGEQRVDACKPAVCPGRAGERVTRHPVTVCALCSTACHAQ